MTTERDIGSARDASLDGAQLPGVLHGTGCTLRPVRPDDLDVLAEILTEPDVARWWPRQDAKEVQRTLIEATESVVFVVEVDDVVIGSIQYVEEPAPDYRNASVDVFLASAWHGKGLGTDAVRTLARHLLYDRGHHRLAIDPAVANERAIRTYRRVGFRPVGVLRSYERGADGEWQDCLLMDLLKHELQ